MMIDDTLRLVCVYMLLLREDFSVNKFGNVQGPTFGLVKVQLARLYLRTLYVILPIHLNFPIRSRCVLKTVIHRTNTVLCFTVTWESFFFFQKDFLYCTCIWYLIIFSILSLFLFFMFLYLLLIYYFYHTTFYSYTMFFLNICKGLFHISLSIGTNGKPLAAIGKFHSAISKLMIGKTLDTNG